jgi:hypothetical protein
MNTLAALYEQEKCQEGDCITRTGLLLSEDQHGRRSSAGSSTARPSNHQGSASGSLLVSPRRSSPVGTPHSVSCNPRTWVQ